MTTANEPEWTVSAAWNCVKSNKVIGSITQGMLSQWNGLSDHQATNQRSVKRLISRRDRPDARTGRRTSKPGHQEPLGTAHEGGVVVED